MWEDVNYEGFLSQGTGASSFIKAGNMLATLATVSFSIRTLPHGLNHLVQWCTGQWVCCGISQICKKGKLIPLQAQCGPQGG